MWKQIILQYRECVPLLGCLWPLGAGSRCLSWRCHYPFLSHKPRGIASRCLEFAVSISPWKWHLFTLWGNQVLVNCAKKLLIFAFDVDSKIPSGTPAVSSPETHRRVAPAEEHAGPLTASLRPVSCLMAQAHCSHNSWSLRGITCPCVHMAPPGPAANGWCPSPDFYHFPWESVPVAVSWVWQQFPLNFPMDSDNFCSSAQGCTRLPRWVWQCDVSLHHGDGSGLSASEPSAPLREVRPPRLIHCQEGKLRLSGDGGKANCHYLGRSRVE